MKYPVIAIAGLLLLCVIISGCTSSSEPVPVTTPAPETLATPVPTTATVAVTATQADAADVPVQDLPSPQAVAFELTKDRPTSTIHLLYQGGAGTMFTQKVIMRVYSTDTEYKEYLMKDGERPAAGDEIVAAGTRGGDRCVVFVTSGGAVYKVIDKKLYSDI